MEVCKLCLNKHIKLIDSHIIPRAFYESMRMASEKGQPFLLMSNTPGTHKSRSQIGIYDDQLVCCECEKRFSKCDNYATKFFLTESNFTPMISQNQVVGWSAEYNYERLKFFFLTLLWRAGATNIPFFKAISLGSHLETLRSLILADFVGTHQDYPVFLGRYADEVGRAIIMDPHIENRKTFDGLNFYRFYLGSGFMAYIKVDKRPFIGDFVNLFLNENEKQLYVLSRGNFSEKKELDVAIDILDKNQAY